MYAGAKAVAYRNEEFIKIEINPIIKLNSYPKNAS